MSDEVKDQTPNAPAHEETSTRQDEGRAASSEPPATESMAKDDDVPKSDKADEGHKPSADENKAVTPDESPDAPPKPSDDAEDTQLGAATETAYTNGATPQTNKNQKRKSVGGGSDAKGKKLNRKKSTVNLQLNVKPGQFWEARLKGYPPWPAVICDEEMLPESLLKNRPVSAARSDGTYREDFMEGGKNAKDRRYPVMFLGTNEFAWQINTELKPLDIDKIKEEVRNNEQGKKSKSLWEAYQIVAEGHDLDYFKGMLREHEEALQADRDERAELEARKQARKEKGSKRKSIADEDIDMEDVDEDVEDTKKAKAASKKRKKDVESEGEAPKKTPKTTKLKVNGPKTPKEESAVKPKKSATKAKKKAKAASDDEETPKPEEPTMTLAEIKKKKQQAVLYLRHRLQKGFLTRDQPPKHEEMPAMAGHFTQLEQHKDLEADIMRETKIHKVLRAILKLGEIPREDEYHFKQRSSELLQAWNQSSSGQAGGESGDAPAAIEQAGHAANGSDAGKAEGKEAAESKEPETNEDKTEVSAEPESVKTKDSARENAPDVAEESADVTMADAPEDAPPASAEQPNGSDTDSSKEKAPADESNA